MWRVGGLCFPTRAGNKNGTRELAYRSSMRNKLSSRSLWRFLYCGFHATSSITTFILGYSREYRDHEAPVKQAMRKIKVGRRVVSHSLGPDNFRPPSVELLLLLLFHLCYSRTLCPGAWTQKNITDEPHTSARALSLSLLLPRKISIPCKPFALHGKRLLHRFGAVLIALSVITVPFRIGFDALPEGGWVVVDWVTDCTFAVDIVLNFRMAYANGHVLVTSPDLMASHYLRGWFTTDFLSTVPFDRLTRGEQYVAVPYMGGFPDRRALPVARIHK